MLSIRKQPMVLAKAVLAFVLTFVMTSVLINAQIEPEDSTLTFNNCSEILLLGKPPCKWPCEKIECELEKLSDAIGELSDSMKSEYPIYWDGNDGLDGKITRNGGIQVGVNQYSNWMNSFGSDTENLLILESNSGVSLHAESQVGLTSRFYGMNFSEKLGVGQIPNFSVDPEFNLFIYENAYLHNRLNIGTYDDPNYANCRLAVDGNIVCEELKVELSEFWGDYVFSEDYDLIELSEIEKYVKDNKHLPGIPSAECLNDEGIEVSSMLNKQMVKIEELTLYLIELEKKNTDLLKRIQFLEAKM